MNRKHLQSYESMSRYLEVNNVLFINRINRKSVSIQFFRVGLQFSNLFGKLSGIDSITYCLEIVKVVWRKADEVNVCLNYSKSIHIWSDLDFIHKKSKTSKFGQSCYLFSICIKNDTEIYENKYLSA